MIVSRRCSWCGLPGTPSSPILAAGPGGELPVHAPCAAECLPRELDPHVRAARRNVVRVAVLTGLLMGTCWAADCERRWDAEPVVTAPVAQESHP